MTDKQQNGHISTFIYLFLHYLFSPLDFLSLTPSLLTIFISSRLDPWLPCLATCICIHIYTWPYLSILPCTLRGHAEMKRPIDEVNDIQEVHAMIYAWAFFAILIFNSLIYCFPLDCFELSDLLPSFFLFVAKRKNLTIPFKFSHLNIAFY